MKSILIFDHFLPQIFFLFDTFPMKMNKIFKVTKQSAEMNALRSFHERHVYKLIQRSGVSSLILLPINFILSQ